MTPIALINEYNRSFYMFGTLEQKKKIEGENR